MKSVADQLRRDLAVQIEAMSIDERFDLVDKLAEQDLSAFQSASGLGREDAIRELTRRRQADRQPSRVASSFFDDLPRT